jgi:hypothetical protein
MAEVSFAQPVPVEERIPESAKFDKLSSGSVIRGRRTVKYVPSTGSSVSSAGGSQIITFRISDSNAFLDGLSTYLTFTATIPQLTISAGSGGVVQDDMAMSFFNRVKTEVNSVACDDIVNNDSLQHALVYLLGDKHAYCQDLGLQAGSWKWNDENYGVANQTSAALGVSGAVVNAEYNAEGSQDAVQRRAQVYWRTLYNGDGSATATSTQKVQFAIPLSYLGVSLCKQTSFIPLRNLGVFTINLYTNTAARALRCGAAADAALGNTIALTSATGAQPVSFTLSNLAIIGQVIDMDPRYLEITDRVATTSEQGLVMPLETYTNLQNSYTSAATATDRTLTFSKASTSLRNMYLVRQPSAWRESPAYSGITGFPFMGCAGFRVQINSLYIPEYGLAESSTEQYNLARQAHALLGNQDAIGNIRADAFTQVPSASSDINGQHILAVGFDRSTSEYLSLDGLNSVSSGGTITVYLRDAGSTDAGGAGQPITVNAWVEFTRFLQLRMNQVSIVG